MLRGKVRHVDKTSFMPAFAEGVKGMRKEDKAPDAEKCGTKPHASSSPFSSPSLFDPLEPPVPQCCYPLSHVSSMLPPHFFLFSLPTSVLYSFSSELNYINENEQRVLTQMRVPRAAQ